MKTLRREIGHGGKIPRGWGLAWYEPRRRVGVYFPVPFHWIARACLEFLYRLRLAVRAPHPERAELITMQRSHADQQRMADDRRIAAELALPRRVAQHEAYRCAGLSIFRHERASERRPHA